MDISEIFLKKKINIRDFLSGRKPGIAAEEKTCDSCGSTFKSSVLKDSYYICPNCGAYQKITPRERIDMIADPNSFSPLNFRLKTGDPLNFPGYLDKIKKLKSETGAEDAILCGTCSIGGINTAVGVMDNRFLMGSMGTVLGESVVKLSEYAKKKKLPLIIFCTSGGARMQEGIFSLMQMAKTSAAIERFKEAGGLYISVLCNPTTGGVSASFAFLGDIIAAEPGALIGFAGPRVIKQTIGQDLPEGFQSAESQLENGMLDMLLPRRTQRVVLKKILRLHRPVKEPFAALRKEASLTDDSQYDSL